MLSRQRKWALRMKEQGKCMICGKDAKTKKHCEYHAEQHSLHTRNSMERKAKEGCIKCGAPLKTKYYCEEHRPRKNNG